MMDRLRLSWTAIFPTSMGLLDQGLMLKRNIAGILKTSNNRALLVGVIPNGGQASTGGVSYQRFTVVHALVGDSSLHKISVPSFDLVEADLTGFEAWFWFQSIAVSREKNRIAVEWNKPEPAIYSSDGETLTIEFDVVGRIPFGRKDEEIALKERATARIKLANPQPLDQRNRQDLASKNPSRSERKP
jgi:hypothetical protein